MKYGLIVAALLLPWTAFAQDAAVAPADVPVAAPAAAPEIVAPPPEVAPVVVEAPVVDMSPPVAAPEIAPVAPDIGASVAMPDITPPVVEAPAVMATPAMPDVSMTDITAPQAPEMHAPVVEPLSSDIGLKTAAPEHSGGHGGNGGMPEASQPEITIDTTAIGKGGNAHAEGGDANAVLKNDNDVNISNVDINKDGDVSNVNILKDGDVAATGIFKPEIDNTNTNIVKPVQETTVHNEDKNVNNNSDYTKVGVDTKTNINVEVNPKIYVKPEIDVQVKTGDVKVYVQAPAQQQQAAVRAGSSSSSSSLGIAAIGIGAALLLNKRGDDRDYDRKDRKVVTQDRCFYFNRYGERVRVSCAAGRRVSYQKPYVSHENPLVKKSSRSDPSKGVVQDSYEPDENACPQGCAKPNGHCSCSHP